MPYETAIGSAVVQVISNGTACAVMPLTVAPAAPRLFSGQRNICIAQNDDGTLHSESNPVKGGHYIGAYLIGLGAVNPSVATGAPARAVPLSVPAGPVGASLGAHSVNPTFLGLIPGYVGLGEVDVFVPSGVAAGLQMFAVSIGNQISNSCLIAVSN